MLRRPCPAVLMLASILVLAAPIRAEYKLRKAPDPADPMQVHLYQLENGLEVYLSENREEPRFYAEIAVRAGSKHDPPEATGIAHYLEHMLFKGSTRIGTLDYEREKPHLDRIEELYEAHWTATDPATRREIYAQINQENQRAAQYAIPNEIDKLYTAMGERGLNAHTSVEETVYKVSLPINRLEHWARIESERFAQPVFRLFQTELETVYEEKNRSLDSKERLIREAVRKVLYKKHPYGQQTTLGSIEHLKNPSLKRMYQFYQTYYVPNNMAIFISGAIDIGETIALIDAEFSDWEPRELPKAGRWKEQKIAGVERVSVQYPGEEYVLLAFRTAPQSHKDSAALEILDMILDNSVAGLINLNLEQRQRVRDAGSYPYFYNDYGAQYLWGIPKQGQGLEEVEALLLEQIELIKKGEFEDWIIPAIVTDFKKTYKRQLESNDARVGIMRDAFIAHEEWDRTLRRLERLARIKKKDVVRAAKKYFKANYVAGYRRDGEPHLPTIEKPALEKIAIDPSRESEFFREISALAHSEIEPAYVVPGRDFKVREIRPGAKLYYARNPLNDLFTLSIGVDLGLLADKRLDIACDFMNKSGTTRFSPEELKKEWYKLGADFTLSSGDHETTISLSGPDENFVPALVLALDFLQHPAASDSTLAELIEIILIRREDAQKDNRTISRALYQFNRLGENAPYRRVLPNAALAQLQARDLHDLIGSLLHYEATLSYTGSLPLEDILQSIRQYYPLPDSLRQPPPYQPLDIRRPEATEIYFFDREMAQSLVRIEIGDEPYNESRRPAIQLYNEYFGGMAGIVFQELREARALAYSAGARYIMGEYEKEQNIMAGAIGCQADKTAEAVRAFVDLLDNLPISPERFETARTAQISRYRTAHLGFRQILGAVLIWERLGVPIDPRGWRLEQIQRADIERMLEFHRERLGGRAKMISIVGDKRKIDMEGLAASGKIIALALEDIFGF